MLGTDVSQTTVAQYMVRHRKPPSQTWRTFLDNHAKDFVSIDFFTVYTATFRIHYVLLVLRHERRQVVYFHITEYPTSQWVAQRMVEAFPWDEAPRYLLRDRDNIYDTRLRRRVHSLGIEEVLTAPRSPWQNPYVERLIGSVRRECLNHLIVLNEHHLKRLLRAYFSFYHAARRHLAFVAALEAPRRPSASNRSRKRCQHRASMPQTSPSEHFPRSDRNFRPSRQSAALVYRPRIEFLVGTGEPLFQSFSFENLAILASCRFQLPDLDLPNLDAYFEIVVLDDTA